jgi:hypothetical protein
MNQFRIVRPSFRGKDLGLKIFAVAFLLFIQYSLIINPVYAKVDLGERFGFGDIHSLGQAIDRLVLPVFSIATALVVFFFLFGAFKILKSAGEEGEVKEGREMMTHSIIGFVFLMAAFIILQFLLSSLFGINNLKIIQ